VTRERFESRLGVVLSMIGVAIGLGNVWRFPYMVGSFGGGAFVLVYLATALLVGVPALMTEWALGRDTQRGTVGAFERGGLPGGRAVGWFFFFVVTAATAYYVNVIGWVGWHAAVELSTPLGRPIDGAWILPPDSGTDVRSLALQAVCTTLVITGCVAVLRGGLRRGIERASLVITPLLFVGLLVLVLRSVTLPGAGQGIRWLLDFDLAAVTPAVVLAALSQVIFSLALGGTFMVVYGSYLDPEERLGRAAVFTVLGDTGAGLLAGLAIVPAVFALGMEPGSGPGLLFATLPEVLGQVAGGWIVGGVFFLALGGAAFLSAVAAFEVLVAGITDNTGVPRGRAIMLMAGTVLALSVPPMVNMEIFVPWDLAFGSGMQTLGALVAALTFGWALDRERGLRALASGTPTALHRGLHLWVRFVVPGAVLAVGAWWVAGTLSGSG
jgi:NSS family neurotransmitter:Na+ symporter